MQIFEVFGDIVLRDNGAMSQLNRLDNAVERVQAGMQQFGSNMMNIGSQLTGFGTNMWNSVSVPILNVIKDSVMMRSNLTESFNVVDTVFGKSSGEVKKWSGTLMDGFGMTKLMALDYVGSMGAMLEASGLNTKQTKDFSKKLVELTGDMSSFYNLSHEETWEKIRAGISGETEPLKSLGINMSVANMEAYALSKGIETSWKEMSQAEQTTLRYNYLMDKTTKIHGDFEKTGDSFANRLRKLGGEWDNLKMAIGERLLPIAEKALDLFIKFKNKIQDIPGIGKMGAALAALAVVFGPVIVGIGVLTTIIGGLIAVIGAVGFPIFAAIAAISAMIPVWVALTGAVTYVYYKLGILKTIFEGVKNAIGFVTAVIKGEAVGAMNILTEKFGLNAVKAADLTNKFFKAKAAIIKVGQVAKNTGKLIMLIFSGKQQQIINLLMKKFGLSKKQALNFWKEVQVLRQKAIELGKSIKATLIIAVERASVVIRKASNYFYQNRAVILKVISSMIRFGSVVISIMSKVLSAARRAIVVGSIIAIGIGKGISKAVSHFRKLKSIASSIMSGVANTVGRAVSAFFRLAGAIGRVIGKISSIKFPSPPSWLPGFAAGVTNFRGGLAMVGEKGPELVQLPRGSNVIPNNRLQNYAANLKNRALSPLKSIQEKAIGKETSVILNMYNTITYDADIDIIMNKAVDRLKTIGVSSNA